jgi:hypothetical protein
MAMDQVRGHGGEPVRAGEDSFGHLGREGSGKEGRLLRGQGGREEEEWK